MIFFRIVVLGFLGFHFISVLWGQGSDLFAEREEVGVGESGTSAFNALAGMELEAGERSLVESATGSTVWWKWRATSSGMVVWRVSRADFDHVLGLGRGTSLDQLEWLDVTAGFTGLKWAQVTGWVKAGEEYVVCLDGVNGQSGSAFLEVRLEADAQPRSTYNQMLLTLQKEVDIWTNNFGVVSSPQEPAAFMQLVVDLEDQVVPAQSEKYWAWKGGHALWWRLPKPRGEYVFSTAGTVGEHWATLYRGKGSGSLIHVETASATDRGVRFRTFLNREGDEDYWLVVDTRGRSSHVHLNIRPVQIPSHGAFANRIVLEGSEGRVTGSNFDAPVRPEAGTPLLGPEKSKGWPTVWYQFRPAATGYYSMELESASDELFVHVFRGAALGGLQEVAESFSLQRKCVFMGQEGVSYAIAVHGVRGVTADFVLKYRAAVLPTHDGLGGAISVTLPTFEDRADTSDATLERGEVALKGMGIELAGARSLWFYIKQPGAGQYVISTRGTEYPHVLDVYSSAVRGILPTTSQLRAWTNRVAGEVTIGTLWVVNLAGGTDYVVRMSSVGEDGGASVMRLFAAGSLNVQEVQQEGEGMAQFALYGVPKTGYRIQSSQNLISWTVLTNVALVTPELLFELSVPSFPQRPTFYRATRFP